MSFLYVGTAAAVVGTVGSAVSAATAEKPSSKTSLQFPKETRQLFQGLEEPTLRGGLQEQRNLLAPLLGGFRTRDQAQQQFNTQQARSLALSAGQRGAQQGGITNLGPLFDQTQGLSPELLAALQGLALQRGQQTNAVVPPGYGQFLSPQTISTQQGGGGSAYEAGFQIAAGLGSIAGAYYNRGR